MREPKDTPQHNILVQHIVTPRRRVAHTTNLDLALQRVAASGVELVVLVFRHPEVVLCEERALGLRAVGVGEEELCWRRGELVADGFAGDRVWLGEVLHFEDSVVEGCCVDALGGGDLCLADFIHVSIGVCSVVHSQWKAFLLYDSVFCAVDRWIHAHAENMLMVLCQRARTDDISPVTGLSGVDVDDRYNTRCSGFNSDACSLVELVVEDVLIVRKCDDELDNQFATTSYHSAACAPVGVFPVNTVVLFVKTDDVFCVLGGTIGVDENTVEVL